MNSIDLKIDPRRCDHGFTLVEMLVVIAIMSILMTAGAIGLGGMGGKGVTSGVATAESLFDEARGIAIGSNVRACVLVAKDLTNNKSDNLKRIVVASEEIETLSTSPNYGRAKTPDSPPNWVISSRGTVLPDQVFFSKILSEANTQSGSGSLDTVPKTRIKGAQGVNGGAAAAAKAAYDGEYYIYEFSSQGICKSPGASFIIGSGARKANATASDKPRVTASAKKDFGGFMIWKNGRTSTFRSPEQMKGLDKVDTGF